MIYVNNDVIVPVKFPGGELHVVVDPSILYCSCNINIVATIENSDDVMCLLLVTDAIKRINPDRTIRLTMPYVPYARQDRVTASGEPLSIKVFADLINSQGYSEVCITDPHSDVTPALFSRVKVTESIFYVAKIFQKNLLNYNDTILISPDAGALKKVNKIAALYNSPVVCASKFRDTKTGKLSNPTIDFSQVDVYNKDLLIVDDIVDGGGSFIQLAKLINEKIQDHRSLNLYATHGIFSRGVDVVTEHFDKVFTVYPFSEVDRTNLILL